MLVLYSDSTRYGGGIRTFRSIWPFFEFIKLNWLRLLLGLWVCGQRPCVVHISTGHRASRAISAWRGHTVFETTCWLIETGTAPTATAKSCIDAVPLHRADHVSRGETPFS